MTRARDTMQNDALSARRSRASEYVMFFRAFWREPLKIAAVAPSGPALARLITSEITAADAPVLELGPGTGVFTAELVRRGVPEDRLVLLEREPAFATILATRYPAAQVLTADATDLPRLAPLGMGQMGAVVSGLPILSMSPRAQFAILEGVFRHLKPTGAFYQFTYGPRCPLPLRFLDRLGLRAVEIGHTNRNIPPAAVYRITRRPARQV